MGGEIDVQPLLELMESPEEGWIVTVAAKFPGKFVAAGSAARGLVYEPHRDLVDTVG